MFACQECGKVFKSAIAAERAADVGCPKCGGVDIDLASVDQIAAAKKKPSRYAAFKVASDVWKGK